eukprot:CAMPEP_0196823956 /NCGR_PEP_ID=MMETSP1362-20130617/89780_1 /TAXON_ID=163516 /ORGANISM="Leptocylindrus danicus, Strain CCMP1856" /LENGTH=63 /DNA_ID=CAMNT_0042204021 /DNA_START=207 /DNA_END=398 /DNA_ORIENTATION=+
MDLPSGDLLTVASSGFTITGNDGPYTSTSRRPILPPCCARAYARFAATVDFPTPPLQLYTAKN